MDGGHRPESDSQLMIEETMEGLEHRKLSPDAWRVNNLPLDFEVYQDKDDRWHYVIFYADDPAYIGEPFRLRTDALIRGAMVAGAIAAQRHIV